LPRKEVQEFLTGSFIRDLSELILDYWESYLPETFLEYKVTVDEDDDRLSLAISDIEDDGPCQHSSQAYKRDDLELEVFVPPNREQAYRYLLKDKKKRVKQKCSGPKKNNKKKKKKRIRKQIRNEDFTLLSRPFSKKRNFF
jgi:hypothetical protein